MTEREEMRMRIQSTFMSATSSEVAHDELLLDLHRMIEQIWTVLCDPPADIKAVEGTAAWGLNNDRPNR